MANSLEIIEITGVRPGKTLVVTGGMDGDEYAGIEAARALIDLYSDRQFAGVLATIQKNTPALLHFPPAKSS